MINIWWTLPIMVFICTLGFAIGRRHAYRTKIKDLPLRELFLLRDVIDSCIGNRSLMNLQTKKDQDHGDE